MTKEKFKEYLSDRLYKISDVLKVKALEYARNDNPLHNFEVGAEMTGQTAPRILDGFLLKHIISYRDMLNDADKDIYPSWDVVNEKFGDIINYFILQEILFKELILTNENKENRTTELH